MPHSHHARTSVPTPPCLRPQRGRVRCTSGGLSICPPPEAPAAALPALGTTSPGGRPPARLIGPLRSQLGREIIAGSQPKEFFALLGPQCTGLRRGRRQGRRGLCARLRRCPFLTVAAAPQLPRSPSAPRRPSPPRSTCLWPLGRPTLTCSEPPLPNDEPDQPRPLPTRT